jgi:CRISPR-associated protein Cas1
MGFEGHAAAVYWGRLVRLIPTAFAFGGRVTGSATDPVNQCLNYTYGILYGEVWRAIVKAGLDPYFGLMHGSKRDQGSLVFDLIEEFRAPFADRLVVGMLGRGFQPEIGEHGLLKTKTRKQLATAFIKRWLDKIPWRSRTINPASLLMRQARDLARLFSHEGSYHPFKMKW